MGRFPEISRPAYRGNYTPASRGIEQIFLIMLHSTEGSAESAASWFANPASESSAHVTIKENGDRLRHVRDQDIAWTNGNWSINQKALSIEFEGYAGRQWVWDNQFESAADLMARWSRTWDLSLNLVGDPTAGRIILPFGVAAHRQVIGSDHTDPGVRFPYHRLVERAKDIRAKLNS